MAIQINEIVGFASKSSRSSFELYQYPYLWPYPPLSNIINDAFVLTSGEQNNNLNTGRNSAARDITLSTNIINGNDFYSAPTYSADQESGVYSEYWLSQIISSESLVELPVLKNTKKYRKDQISCETYKLVDHTHWVGVGYDCSLIKHSINKNQVIPKRSESHTVEEQDLQPLPKECVTNEDCRPDQMCLEGQCVQSDGPIDDEIIGIDPGTIAPFNECTTDRDCPRHQICRDGWCYEDDTMDEPIEILPALCYYNGWFVCGTTGEPPEPTIECSVYNSDQDTCQSNQDSHGSQCVWCPRTASNCVSELWLTFVQEIFENMGSVYECYDGVCGCKDVQASNYCPGCLDCNDEFECADWESDCSCVYQYPDETYLDNRYGGYIELAGDESLEMVDMDLRIRQISPNTDGDDWESECKLPLESIPSEGVSSETPWYLVLFTDNIGNNGDVCYTDDYGIHLPFWIATEGRIELYDANSGIILTWLDWDIPVWKPDFGYARTMNIDPTDNTNLIQWLTDEYKLSTISANVWNYICSETYCYNKATPGGENLMRSSESTELNGNYSVSCDGICGDNEAQSLALDPSLNWRYGDCYCNRECVDYYNCCYDYIQCPSDMPTDSKVYIWYTANYDGDGFVDEPDDIQEGEE